MAPEDDTRPELASVREALGHVLISIVNGMVHVRRTNSRACVRVHFETSNGWKLSVFNDAGVWDYLDRAEDPQGHVLNYEDIQDLKGIDWGDVSNARDILGHDVWGRPFLLQTEFDDEYPDQDESERYN